MSWKLGPWRFNWWKNQIQKSHAIVPLIAVKIIVWQIYFKFFSLIQPLFESMWKNICINSYKCVASLLPSEKTMGTNYYFLFTNFVLNGTLYIVHALPSSFSYSIFLFSSWKGLAHENSGGLATRYISIESSFQMLMLTACLEEGRVCCWDCC